MLSTPGEWKRTGLDWALYNKKSNIIEVIANRFFCTDNLDGTNNQNENITEEQSIVLPYLCMIDDAEKLKVFLDSIAEKKKILDYKTNKGRNILSVAADVKNKDVAKLVADHLYENDLLTETVKQTDNFDSTVLHWACYRNNTALLKRIFKKVDQNVLREGLLKEDKAGKNALHKACENVPKKHGGDTVLKLLTQYSKDLQPSDLRKWGQLLNKKDMTKNKPFQLADNRLMEQMLDDIDPEEEWDEISNIPWVLILSQKNKFGFCSFDYDSNVKKVTQLFDKLLIQNVSLEKSLGNCFPEFADHIRRSKELLDSYRTNPITLVGQSGKLALLKHPYIQVYVDTCWKSSWIYLPFYAYVSLYFVFFVGLCCYTSSYGFSVESEKNTTLNNITYENTSTPTSTTKYVFSSTCIPLTMFGFITTILLAFFGIVHEIVQMCNMRKQYLKGPENYADLVHWLTYPKGVH